MYLVAGGSVAGGGGGGVPILLSRILRVDPVNGDDAGATPGDFGDPYQTITGALADLQDGDTVYVGPGTYNEKNLYRTGIEYKIIFAPGAFVDYTGPDEGGIFDDSSTGANGPVTCQVLGHGRFRWRGSGTTAFNYDNTKYAAVIQHNAGSVTTIEFDLMEATSTRPSHTIFHTEGTLNLRFNELKATGSLTVALRWDSGPLDVEGLRLTSGFYATYTDNPTGSAPADDMRLRVNYIVGDHRQTNTINADTKVWIECLEWLGKPSIEGGKFYLPKCGKLSVTTGVANQLAVSGVSQSWITIQKLTIPGRSNGAASVSLAPSSTGFCSANFQQIENTGALTSGSAVGLFLSGPADVKVSYMTIASGTLIGVRLLNGARLEGYIDGRLATTGNPINILTATPTLRNVTVLAATGREAINGFAGIAIEGFLAHNETLGASVTTSGNGIIIANGIPLVPTASPGTNNTQAASTAYADASSTAAASTKADSVHTHVYTDLPDLSPTSLLGNPNGGSSSPEEVDIGTGLGVSGGALNNTDRGSTAVTTHEAAVNPHTQYAPKADPIFTSTLTASTHFTINSSGSLRINGQAGQFPIDIYNAAGTTALFRVTNGTGDVTSLGTYNAATAYRVTAFGAYMGVNAGARFIFQNGYTQLVNPLEHQQVASGGTPSTDSFRFYGLDVAGTCEAHVKDEAGNQTQISPHAMDGPSSLYDATDPLPHVIKEHNDYLGGVRYLNVSRACYLLEELLKAIEQGRTLAQIRTALTNKGPGFIDIYRVEAFAQHNTRLGWIGTPRELVKRDWDTDQNAKQAEYNAKVQDALNAHAAWLLLPPNERGPEPVVPPAIDIRKPKPAWLAAREV